MKISLTKKELILMFGDSNNIQDHVLGQINNIEEAKEWISEVSKIWIKLGR